MLTILISQTLVAISQPKWELSLEGDEFRDLVRFDVTGRSKRLFEQQEISFAQFRTGKIKYSPTREHSKKRGPQLADNDYIYYSEAKDRRSAFKFSLSDSSRNLADVSCQDQSTSKDFNIGNNSLSAINLLLDAIGTGGHFSRVFSATISVKDVHDKFELVVDKKMQKRLKNLIGIVAKNGQILYQVSRYGRVKNTKGKVVDIPSSGLVLKEPNGRVVAVIFLLGEGSVYLPKINPKERLIVSSVCAALLLQSPY